jgi:FAD/FMN-containing dehydrogenase
VTGLFVNFQATTGIVTRAAIQLFARHPHRKRAFVLAETSRAAFALLERLSHEDFADDVGGVCGAMGKMLFAPPGTPFPRAPGEPAFAVYVDLSGATAGILAAKWKRLTQLAKAPELEGLLELDDLLALDPAFARYARFPVRLDFLLDHPGGGLSWLGTYGPLGQAREAFDRGLAILEEHRFSPAIVVRSMHLGHFCVVRFIELFDRADAAERERVARVNRALLDAVLPLGFFPYKTPAWAIAHLRERFDPGFVSLVQGIQRLADPDGILSPGCWSL